MRTILLSTALLLGAATLHAQTAKHASATEPAWGPAPAVFPAGAQMAVISGDPSKAAPFTVELKVPDGYKIPPHFHPTDETVTVKEGTFNVGMGDTLDLAKTKAMKPGDKGTIPAGHHHYAAASGPTVVKVNGMGPFAMTYVNPADDPQKKQ
ncbi:MAG TPA: cupin domain-containing protein [Gemmatimonadales bacterium]|nr:cupin domain-containing protein [Gemmatimonadales bacterium]